MLKVAIAPFLLLASAQTVLAHSGHHHHFTGGISEGFLHPFTGLDHLLALLAVGIWCALQQKKEALLSAGTLAAGMVMGAVIGMGIDGGLWMEASIAVSVLAMGLLIIFRQVSVRSAALVAATVGVIHGLAHGAEMPAHDRGAFILGFVLASTLIFVLGRLAMNAGAALANTKLSRFGFGGITALAGALLTASVLR